MKFEDNDKRYKIREFLKACKVTSKLVVERMNLINASAPGSFEQKIHTEVLNGPLKAQMEDQCGLVYSLILSYNKNPNDWAFITQGDILEASLYWMK
jgi:hypothetical protein